MKYLHYYPRALVGNGGPTAAVWSWVRALKEVGQEVEVLFDSDLFGSQILTVPGVRLVPVRHRLHGRWRHPIGIADHLSSDTVLIVHSAFLLCNILAACTARGQASKTIFVPHGAYDRNARRRNKLLKRIWLMIERAVVEHSSAVHAFVDSEIPCIREVVPTIPIIVAPTPVAVSCSDQWHGGGGYIGWFGRYDIDHKGLDILLQAYHLVPQHLRIPIRLHGRDSTNSRNELAQLVVDANLQDVISVGGPIEGKDKTRFLSEAEFFVMPSRYESFSIALLEVLAMNVPAIISDKMPIAQQLKSNQACVVTPIEPQLLASALECVLRNPSRMRDAVRPRQYVERNLTHRAAGLSLLRQIEQLGHAKA
jgi:glycosyltransferase involved in cell wall biosynthesis